jgi:hypothetical protein
MRETAMPSPSEGRAAEIPTWRVPMQTIGKTIRTLGMTATVLAGAALMSGWLNVAMAGGGRWAC